MSHERRNALLNELLPMARELLEKTGEFLPFAAAIAANGEMKLIAGTPGGDHAEPRAIVKVLADGLAQGVKAGQYIVTAICFPADIQQGVASDTICIEFEDGEAEPTAVLVPYIQEGRFIELGEMTLSRCESRVFCRLDTGSAS